MKISAANYSSNNYSKVAFSSQAFPQKALVNLQMHFNKTIPTGQALVQRAVNELKLAANSRPTDFRNLNKIFNYEKAGMLYRKDVLSRLYSCSKRILPEGDKLLTQMEKVLGIQVAPKVKEISFKSRVVNFIKNICNVAFMPFKLIKVA